MKTLAISNKEISAVAEPRDRPEAWMSGYAPASGLIDRAALGSHERRNGPESLSLEAIVEVNERLKKVVVISAQVYIIAINAMLAARPESGRARGYATVTTQLRSFSKALDGKLGALTRQIYQLVMIGAKHSKQSRENEYLLRTARVVVGSVDSGVTRMLMEQERQLLALRVELDHACRCLTTELERVQAYCLMGENLALLARIEAQGAGSAGTLEAVARSAQVAIVAMGDELKCALRRLVCSA